MVKSTGYCVKCKVKRELSTPKIVTKNGHKMKGRCSTCGTKINSSSKVDENIYLSRRYMVHLCIGTLKQIKHGACI